MIAFIIGVTLVTLPLAMFLMLATEEGIFSGKAIKPERVKICFHAAVFITLVVLMVGVGLRILFWS